MPDAKIRRVVLCSGKVYYDLYEERERRGIDDIAIVRIEQLYPFPKKALRLCCRASTRPKWSGCQEEPPNMGAWVFVDTSCKWVLNQIGAQHRRAQLYRPAGLGSRSAVGQLSLHLAQLKQFLEEALG